MGRRAPRRRSGRDDGVDLVVGADRVVVEEQHGLGAGQLRQSHRVVGRRVPHATRRQLLGGVLGVVDQQVDAGGQRQGGVVVRPPAVRARPQRRRTVVGQVGDRRAARR